MIELVFVACLASSSACEERVQTFLPEIGLMGCMMTAQQQLAAWTAAHPAHRIDRWQCSVAGTRGEKA